MRTRLCPFFLALAIFASVHHAAAQGTTAFTYQGQLRDNGTNANGIYTMIFRLYDANTNGNQVGGPITNTPNLFNGLFTVNLDFGASVFKGSARWLDITVTNGPTTETLWPRVQVLPSPYALFATLAGAVTNGAIGNAQLATNAVASTNIQNGAVTSAQLAFGAVANSNLAVNAVATSNLQDSAVTSVKIADGAISNRDLSVYSVTATNIAPGQVVKTINGIFTDNVTLSLIGIVQSGANTALFPVGPNLTNIQVSALVPNMQVFTTSGTFNVPTNVTRIKVELWGGGGGGGKGSSSSWDGGGGGAGGYAFNVLSVSPGANYSVTVGIGGTNTVAGTFSSFGTLLGAAGGAAGTNAASNAHGGGGAGGTVTNSLISFVSGAGQPGTSIGGGNGGSPLGPLGGAGGLGGVSGPINSVPGMNANGPGGGGGGSSAGSNPALGGTGGNGLVIVTY